MGRLFDDRGHRMTPSTARKAGRTYRYYISSALHQGRREETGSLRRVAAPEVETAIVRALKEQCPGADRLSDNELVERHLVRAQLSRTAIEIELALTPHVATDIAVHAEADADDENISSVTLNITWSPGSTRRARDIIIPEAMTQQTVRPIEAATRATLVRSIALGRCWLADITRGAVAGPEAIAKRRVAAPGGWQ